MTRRDKYKQLFDDVLTDADYEKAIELRDADRISDQIMKPIIARIDEVTKQRNDPKFMAYALIMILGL